MVAPLVSVVSYLFYCRVPNRVVNKAEKESWTADQFLASRARGLKTTTPLARLVETVSPSSMGSKSLTACIYFTHRQITRLIGAPSNCLAI
jgi:hypothetical protein